MSDHTFRDIGPEIPFSGVINEDGFGFSAKADGTVRIGYVGINGTGEDAYTVPVSHLDGILDMLLWSKDRIADWWENPPTPESLGL